jgi:hypothetical protein
MEGHQPAKHVTSIVVPMTIQITPALVAANGHMIELKGGIFVDCNLDHERCSTIQIDGIYTLVEAQSVLVWAYRSTVALVRHTIPRRAQFLTAVGGRVIIRIKVVVVRVAI